MQQMETKTNSKSVLSLVRHQPDEDLCVSIYLPLEEVESLAHRRLRLEALLATAKELLPAATLEQADDLLAPIRSKIDDMAETDDIKGAAFFRSSQSFYFCDLTEKPPELCVVADSFHIKPLLKCALLDQPCYALSVNARKMVVYRVDRAGAYPIRTYLNEESQSRQSGSRRQRVGQKARHKDNMQRFIKTSVRAAVKDIGLNAKNVAVMGSRLWRKWMITELKTVAYIEVFCESELPSSLMSMRDSLLPLLKDHIKQKAQAQTVTAIESRDKTLVSDSLSEIAAAAVAGRVDKLLVDASEHIWGQFDRNDGRIVTHSEQQDHTDDCVLDDIAQEVLKYSGDVAFIESSEASTLPRFAAVLRW